ncbi:carboxypeptidase-like regulatory domain-containing protein [Bacteroidota bacterium]
MKKSDNILAILSLALIIITVHAKARNSNDDRWVRIIGSIVDDSTGNPVPYAHIIDTKLNKGASADNEGNFRLLVDSFDTLKITAIGYKDFYLTPYRIEGNEEVTIQIRLIPTAYELEELDIYSEDPIKKFFRDQGQTKSYPINMGKGRYYHNPNAPAAMTGYITAFANLFNKHAKQEKKLTQIKEEELRLQIEAEKNQFIVNRFGEENLSKLTGLSDKDVTQFIKEYPLPDRFVLEANEYEFLAAVMSNLRDYKFRHKLDMDIADILERAIFADEE